MNNSHDLLNAIRDEHDLFANQSSALNIHERSSFETKIAILVAVTFSITFIVGMIGNSLVLLTILFQKQMRSTTNILILNLAIAELLFISICVPFTGLNYVLR
jgi:allatostatin receptor